MNKLLYLVGCTLLCLVNPNSLFSQGGVLEFTNCADGPYRLCAQSPGVRLPDNNQIYLGETHPDASRGSVHVAQSKTVRSDCSATLTYEVQLLLFDSSPSISLKPATTVHTDTDGMALLSYDTEEALDDIVMQNGMPYTTGCDRFHKVRWVVRDTCGNEVSCEDMIEVFDCVEPIVESDPEEVFTITIPIGLQYTVVAKNFVDSALDDQSLNSEFLYSLSKNKYLPKAIYDCCEVPAYGVVVPYSIWISEGGIDHNCDGVVEWSERSVYEKIFNVVYTDNSGSCDCWFVFDSTYTGYIRTRFGEGIKDVKVNLYAPGHVFPSVYTDENGRYEITVNAGTELTITPEKNDNHRNGVTILDLIKLQKHLLGKEPFTSPYEYIAADANNSWSVSAIDLIELRKLVLGVYTELPHNYSWRFVSDETGADVPEDWTFQESLTTNPYLDEKNLNFTGVKIGDLNYTAQPNLNSWVVRESMKQLHLYIDDQSFSFGETIDVPVRSDADISLLGMQFTLETDGMEVLDILPGALNISEQDYALFGDKMTLAWMDTDGVEPASGETLFTLRLKANSAGKLSHSLRIGSTITPAEIYTLDEQAFEPTFTFDTPEVDHSLAEVTCAPNPWTDHTTISFTLKESSDVHIDIYTINGAHVKSFLGKYTAGPGSIIIKQTDLGNEGVYLYRLTSSEFDITDKMLLLK